jgi:hypothetical protein
MSGGFQEVENFSILFLGTNLLAPHLPTHHPQPMVALLRIHLGKNI